MHTRLILPTLMLSLAGAFPSFGFAADGETEIHLVQQAERDVPRDRIHATLRVEAEGAEPAKVQAEVNRRMGEALAAAKREAAVKVETSGYQVYEENAAGKTTPPKWHATQSLLLSGKDFAAALNLIGALQASGLAMEGLTFDVAPETLRATEDDLTAQALEGLHARADRVASDMKMTVTGYKSIEIGNAATQNSRPLPRMMAMTASAPAAAPPAAEAGESTVSLTVDAQIIMAPAKAP